MIAVTGFGLLASFLFAMAAFLQQQGIRSSLHTTAPMSILHGMRRLVRHPVWVLGWCTNLLGFLSQATALHLGSVAVVQPLLATQLPFALIIVSGHRRRFPPLLAWVGSAAICLGLVLLMLVDGAQPLAGDPERPRVLLAAGAAAVLVAVLLALATRASRGSSLPSAVAAGLCFAMSAVFMKLTTQDLLVEGVAHTARDWPGYSLAVSTLAGLLIEQAAFAAGPLTWSVAAMNITNPVASFLVGVLAFRVAVPSGNGTLAGVAGAGLLLVAGITALAHVPIRQSAPGVSPGQVSASAPPAHSPMS